jgi:hypothetical protein
MAELEDGSLLRLITILIAVILLGHAVLRAG